MRIRAVESVESLASLKPDWDRLHASSCGSGPYLSYGWLSAWWDEYSHEEDRLHVLCCHEDASDRLVGVLPAYRQPAQGPFGMRPLRLMGDDAVGSCGLGRIADPSSSIQVDEALCDHLLGADDEWDVLAFDSMYGDDPFLVRLVERSGDTHRTHVRPKVASCLTVALPGTWDEYLMTTLSKNARRNVRRRRQKLESVATVEAELVQDPDSLPTAVRDLTAMFSSSMSRRFDRPFSISERYVRFITDVARDTLETERLRLLFLTTGGRRTAFRLQFRCGDTIFAYQTGFDDEWAALGVGNVSSGYSIEHAIEEGCTRYDFGPGPGRHKDQWGASEARDLADLRIYRPSLAASLDAQRDAASVWLRKAVKRAAPPPLRDRLTAAAGWQRLQRM